MTSGWSRRALLALPIVAGAGTKTHPSEQRSFRDRTTEWVLLRLTDPERGNAWLPLPPCTAIDRSNRVLAMSSDRSGETQIYRYDLRTGVSEQWTDGRAIHPHLFSLLSRNRLLFLDANRVMLMDRKPRQIHATDGGWSLGGTLDVDDRGRFGLFAESREGASRLSIVPLTGAPRSTILGEFNRPIQKAAFRPGSNDLIYLVGAQVHLVERTGRSRPLELPPGTVTDAIWSDDGRTLFFLHSPPGQRRVDLRQYDLTERKESSITYTSQFVRLARNRDSSVFLGVSGNKGSPYLLLLVKAVKRELALAEHAATDPQTVVAIFAPDSQRVYYHSNLQGKSAIYSLDVDRFVEKTADQDSL